MATIYLYNGPSCRLYICNISPNATKGALARLDAIQRIVA